MWQWLRRLFDRPVKREVHPLIRQARSADPEARRGAAGQLTEVPEEWAVDYLVGLSGDSDAAVRECARAGLEQRGESVVPALTRGLNHGEPRVGVVCAESLGHFRHPDAIEPLLLALKYNARPVQLAVRAALIRYGPAVIASLEAGRAETQPWVRQQIEEILDAVRQTAPSDGPAV